MAEFTAGAASYQSGRLDVFKQQGIVRRLAPFLALFAASLSEIGKNPIGALEPLALALSKMTDEDIEYVQHTCLAVVQRQQGTLWAKVWSPGGGLMFQDIGLMELNTITFHVLRDNLSDFFAGIAQLGFAPAATVSV